MAFSDDLLEQANHLATREKKRPKQVSLRRAVSTAYYALFHLLVSEAVRYWKIEDQRAALARGFEHGKMKNACIRLGSSNVDLRMVADTFVELQQNRHRADYDNDKVWTRVEVATLVRETALAFKKWKIVAGKRAAQDFLLSMLVDRK